MIFHVLEGQYLSKYVRYTVFKAIFGLIGCKSP